MSDTETPTTDERSETVTRVLAALSPDTAGGALGRDTLRNALASEGQSLLDLPEVGLWLALTEISLTAPDDLAELPAPDEAERVVLDFREGSVSPATPVVDITSTEPAPAPAPATPAPGASGPAPEPEAAPEPARRSRRSSRRAGRFRPTRPGEAPPRTPEPTQPTFAQPAPVQPAPAPPASAPPASAPSASWPSGLVQRIDEITAYLHLVLADALILRLGDPAAVGTAVPFSPARELLSLRYHIEVALERPLEIRVADPSVSGGAVPDRYWSRPLTRSLAALSSHLAQTLDGPVPLELADPTVPHGATLDPYWPRPVVRRLDALAAFLQSLFELPTEARVPASRLAGTSNGATPDPYWPRHLVRPGASERSTSAVVGPVTAAPRTPDELERDLQDALAAVALVGEADLDAVAAELEISLAQLTRRVPLDRLGRVYPATLAAFLVRQTMLHPDPATFDAEIPVTALRRTNAVGLAFSEALVRLAKPVFREIEQRDEFDRRVRYLRRMQLHGGLDPAAVDAVVEQVRASFWAGAVSGGEVTNDWLLARNAVTASIGAPAFRLLACTDHGASMMAALVDLVRSHAAPEAIRSLPTDLGPLSAAVAARAWEHLSSLDAPEDEWGEITRPRVRLARTLGGGPELELPRTSARWHLNGELLTYGSPSHRKWADLPASRAGKWSMTVGTSSRKSPHDIGFQSAAPDRTVLVFDEHGRLHHHDLRLGGCSATVIAPAGSVVTGETDRTLLIGRWVGFEQIEVDLLDHELIEISARGRETVGVEVTRELGARLVLDAVPGVVSDAHEPVVFRPAGIVFGGHVPPAESVEVAVTDERGRQTSLLSDLWITSDRGAFGLGSLFESDLARRVTVSVQRDGFPPVTRSMVHLPADAVISVPPATDGLIRDLGDASAERWSSDTGLPDTAWSEGDPADAGRTLTSLVTPLAQALQRTVIVPSPVLAPPHQVTFAPLSLHGWMLGLTAESADLDEWVRRHHRPIWRWRSAGTFANLDALWAQLHRTPHTRVALPLVAASLLAFTPGDHRDQAIERLAEAAGSAPRLVRSAACFGAAYARVRTAHPESRFRAIDVPSFPRR